MAEAMDKEPDAESPLAAWRGALLSLDLALDLLVCGLMAALPQFWLPQHVRPLPVQAVQSGYIRHGFVDNAYAADTISNAALMTSVFAVAVPMAVWLSVVSPARGAARAWVHSFIWTLGVTQLITGSVKQYCGYWRPYFLSECGFNATLGACTAPYDDYERAYRSFPSGHASMSMAPMLHTTLRLLGAARLGEVPRRARLGGKLSVDVGGVLSFLCLLPTLFAVWCGASRVHDNAHHPADVVGGWLIGGGCATLWYLRYFPGPFGAGAHRPRGA